MPQTYAFQVSMPVTDILPRNRISNVLHFEHVAGAVLDTDLSGICSALVTLYQAKYGNSTHEIVCKAYDVDAVPNYPRATVSVNAGSPWTTNQPREIALCLSFAGPNKGNKNERGRIYLMPQLTPTQSVNGLRPAAGTLDWALSWYGQSNESLPDIGGVDWKFGVWSRTLKSFRQTTQAWVDDDWDVMRSRGLRESTRVSIQREG